MAAALLCNVDAARAKREQSYPSEDNLSQQMFDIP